MKILLLGKKGQVGWELQRSLASLGEVIALGRQQEGPLIGDLNQLDRLAQTVREVQPQVIVNAAAYTAVDRAEQEPEMAQRVNGDAPGVLAREAAALGAWLIHYSTDYVFDGSGDRPWTEVDATAPLSVYGRTKLDGETRIRATGCLHVILRTSWVYAARGANFAKTMVRLAEERDQLRVVADQVGAPTGADLIADVTALVVRQLRPELAGTYHLAAAGQTSWHGYAQHVLREALALGKTLRVSPDQVESIPSSAYPTPARRPLNSRLDVRKLEQTFGLHMPRWEWGVTRMLSEWLTN